MIKIRTIYFVRFCLVVLMMISFTGLYASPNQLYTDSAQQSWVLKGVVKDNTGAALFGATVIDSANPQNGTATNLDGEFEIHLSATNSEIIVTYLGYETKTIAVSRNRTQISVELAADGVDIEEVQVIAYGTQKKVTITGAVSSVGSDEILKTPTTSMGNALTGRIPGLTSVQYSGEPGADSPTILVRGVSTFSGSTSPLVLVDGVERDFSQLDPNEVEDITVLKDASATAVFGVRGANGVILVTTKRGEEGPARINVSTSLSIQTPVQMLDFTNSADYATFYNEAQMNDGVAAGDVRFSDDVIAAFKDQSNPLLYPDVDWVDYIFKDYAVQTQTNFNVSGGTEKVKYFVSAGATTQDGLLEQFSDEYDYNFNYNRYNYRANIDYDVTKSTKLSVNIGGRVTDKKRPISTSSDSELFRHIYRATPFDGAGIVEGKWIKSNPDYIPGVDGEYTCDALDAFYGAGYYTTSNNVLNSDMSLTQDLSSLTKGLSFNIKGAYNSSFYITKTRTDALATYMPIMTDSGEVGLRKSGADSELGYSESRGAYRNWYYDASLRYARKFGMHNVSGLVLYNQSKEYYPSTYTMLPTGYVGLVGRVTYDYDTRYLFDVNMGYNGSENFHEDRRYGVFPSASLGWVVTQEEFMKNQKVVSYLKFRGSYGVVGNDQTGGSRFMYLPDSYVAGYAWGYNFGTDLATWQEGSYESTIGNAFVTWEKAYKQNYGIDASFFNTRLKLNLDYFTERREDIMLTRNNVPAHLAASLPKVNYGVVENGGYEVVLGWNDKIGKDFRYYISSNLSFARNKVIEMDEVAPNETYLYQTGQPVGQKFGYTFWGFYDEDAEARYESEFGVPMASQEAIGCATLQNGDCIYVDLNKDGAVTEDDMSPIGYTNNPEYSGATTLGFSYKNFSFSMMVNYAWNTSRQLAETFLVPMGSNSQYGLLQYQFDNRWTEATADTATLPRATLANIKNNYANSDLWLVDASYVRLKNIQVSYRINSKYLQNLGVRTLDVTASGYNLLTFTDFELNDPEALSNATPGYPVMKIFNLGLKIGF
ncbi:MAG: TonB-dependent receptor [Rikenellaceae bacterium]